MKRLVRHVVLTAANLLVAAVAVSAPGIAAPPTVRMVVVDEGVELEVLDWGGNGVELVLLAGLGNTAHVYEDVGGMLASDHRVVAVSRRGFGSSTHAHGGYDMPTLARDVARVCSALDLQHPVLIGHSLAGTEMMWFQTRYPGRARALVFLDAAYDHSLIPQLQDLAPWPELPSPTTRELSSARAAQGWLLRTRGFATPLAELEALFRFDSDGRLVDTARSPLAQQLLLDAVAPPLYTGCGLPVLAIYAKPTRDSLFPAYDEFDGPNRELADARAALARNMMSAAIATFEKSCPQARTLVWEGVNHHLFLTETAAVLAEIRAFVAGMPPAD